jgi:6-phosphofructokinase 1
MDFDAIDTTIPRLGEASILSPVQKEKSRVHAHAQRFISDDERVIIDLDLNRLKKRIAEGREIPSFEKAGPREKIYFDPSKLRAALVTCGGLCPGLNDIIRAIVLELYYCYGVRDIRGVRYGLQGFISKYNLKYKELKPAVVANIYEMGGTILGASRGMQDIAEIVSCLDRDGIGILFMIGGDGTLRAANKIADTITEKGLKISVIGVPKTIDNDIHLVSRSFGFHTAVDIATGAIKAAHKEAEGYPNGIGLIKLMGRHSGFIAATATLAQQDVNFTLIPEVDFDLEGPKGFLASLEKRLEDRRHAVIVVAEGAGQRFFREEQEERDESGNVKPKDIGPYLKDKITSYFKAKDIPINLKYIDPSYIIRSLPANSNDNVYCSYLGRDAVHAGMAGKTKLIVSRWNEEFVYVPMCVAASAPTPKQVEPNGKLWFSVLEATGQGSLKNELQTAGA